MRILLHHPNGTDGTSFYRAYGPFNHLVRQFPDVEIVDANTDGIAWHLLGRFDLVYMQRPASKWQRILLDMCKAYGIPVWVDWDDHYFDIPDSNNRKKYYTEFHIDQVRYVAKNADIVSVTTEYLRDAFLPLNKNVIVIPNALDERLFSTRDTLHSGLTTEQFESRRKLILWRGSDTHNTDLDYFKEEILELMDETPEYIWGFFGYYPQWAIDHLPSDRIRLYGYDGPVEYLHRLLMARPHLVYVPLEDTPFNRSRSNIGWLEGSYAGARVVMPKWGGWDKCAGFHYADKSEFKDAFYKALKADNSVTDNAALQIIHEYSLNVQNKVRYDLAKNLIKNYSFSIKQELPEPFTDQEFFDYNKASGWTNENPEWLKGQEKFADYLTDTLGAASVLDIGCGPGGLVEVLAKRGNVAIGIDSNPLNQEFFVKRNPDHEARFILEQAQNVIPGNFFDVVVAVEVFEHIPDDVNSQILQNIRDKCKFFLHTSTPYHSTPQFDRQWGHINVKPTEHWIKFIEAHGFKLVQKVDYPAEWGLLFLSTAPD